MGFTQPVLIHTYTLKMKKKKRTCVRHGVESLSMTNSQSVYVLMGEHTHTHTHIQEYISMSGKAAEKMLVRS